MSDDLRDKIYNALLTAPIRGELETDDEFEERLFVVSDAVLDVLGGTIEQEHKGSENLHLEMQAILESVVLDILRGKSEFSGGMDWGHVEKFIKAVRKYPFITVGE